MAERGEELSNREMDVLVALSKGLTNKEIALHLSISPNTVKVHIRNIYSKLGVSNRTEAVADAVQQGLIEIERFVTNQTIIQNNKPNKVLVKPASPSVHEKDADIVEVPQSIQTKKNHSILLLVGLLITAILIIWQVTIYINKSDATPPFVSQSIDENEYWSTATPMIDARDGFALAAVGSDIYLMSGETKDGIVHDGFALTTHTDVWRPLADKPTAVRDAMAGVVVGQIIIPGGTTDKHIPTDIVEIYSPSNDAWRIAAALPNALTGAVTIAYNDHLYLFGGATATTVLSTAYVYDPTADAWRPLPDMSTARTEATGGVLQGKLYVVGGKTETQELTTCESFDPVDERWLSCADMLQPRSEATSTGLLNQLYVVGGSVEQKLSYGERYDPNTNTWQLFNLPMLDIEANWLGSAMTTVETRIYLFGGRRDNKQTNNSYLYNALPFQFFVPSTIRD